MQDFVLILYVLGLMVLFFFLGAAIGGAARSFKTYFFAKKPHKSIFENPFAGAGAGVAAAAGATVVANQHLREESASVHVTSDEAEESPSEAWTEQPAEAVADAIDTEGDVSRAEEQGDDSIDAGAENVAQPLQDEDMPEVAELGDTTVGIAEEEEPATEEEVVAEQETAPEVEVAAEHEVQETEFTAADYEAHDQASEGADEEEVATEDSVTEVVIEEDAESEQVVDEASSVDENFTSDEIAEAAVASVLGAQEVQEQEEQSDAAEETLSEETVSETERTDVQVPVVAEADDYSDIVFITEGEDDDLTLIKGIDAGLGSQLKEIGLRRYDQIAALNERQVGYLREKFNLSSTLNEQGWIEQAKILSSGALTVYAQSLVGQTEVEADDVSETGDAVALMPDVQEEATEAGDVEQLSEEPVGESEAPSEIIDLTPEDSALEVEATEVVSEEQQQDDVASDETETEVASETADVQEDDDFDESGMTSEEISKRREDRRLFGEKERAERDEEWKSRYQSGRRIQAKNGNGDALETSAFTAAGAVVEDVVSKASDIVEEVTDTAEEIIEDAQDVTKSALDEATDVVADQLSDQEEKSEEISSVEVSTEDASTEDISSEGTASEEMSSEDLSEEDEGGYVRPVDSDDLKQIRFISTGLEKKLNLLGVYKLSQIANWSDEAISEISEQLEFRDDRILKENWRELAQEALDKQKSGEQNEGGGLFSASALIARLAELDKIEDLTEHEKTLLSKNGITELSQIANWSGADADWARGLLELPSHERIDQWIATASALISEGQNDVPGGIATGDADDLKRIRGIDDEAATALKGIGVTTYAQIAAWQQTDMDRINGLLGTAGRVERQYWVVQAKVLKDGGDTDFSKLYDDS